MSKEEESLVLPVVEHLTQEELRQAVMKAILVRLGVDNPSEFLAANTVQVKFNFRQDCGVSVCLLGFEERPHAS